MSEFALELNQETTIRLLARSRAAGPGTEVGPGNAVDPFKSRDPGTEV